MGHFYLFPDATSSALEPSSCTMRASVCTKAEKKHKRDPVWRRSEPKLYLLAVSSQPTPNMMLMLATMHGEAITKTSATLATKSAKKFALLIQDQSARIWSLGRGKDRRMTGGSVTSRPSPSRRGSSSHCGIDSTPCPHHHSSVIDSIEQRQT